jgi:hypothetical protein
MLLLFAAFVSAPRLTQAQAVVQRTIGAASPSTTTTNTQSDAIDNLLRQYRTMWQNMSPAQQKAFLDSGGSTPEQYERVLRTKGLSALPAGPAPTTQAGHHPSVDPRTTVDALGSLTTSLLDLNAIRDGNLVRVQKDGCPPEVTSRLADLRGRLGQDEADLVGVEFPAPVAAQAKELPNDTDPMTIASDWYKQSKPGGAPSNGTRAADTKEAKQLADVLAGGPTASPARRIDPKSPEAQQRQKDMEEEIAHIKSEIAQLSGACTTLKQ